MILEISYSRIISINSREGEMVQYGYARVSTEEQNFDSQIDELVKSGVKKDDIFYEKVSGSVVSKKRTVLAQLLKIVRSNDSITVVKLDRLGRNAIDVLSLIDELNNKNINVKILNLGIDTQKPSGRLFLTMLAGFAEFERELIRERCTAGLAAAKARGTLLGRRHTLTMDQRRHAQQLKTQGLSANDVAKLLNTSKMTAWRAMNDVSKIAS